MDGADSTPAKPIQLSPRQIELVQELSALNTKFLFGKMFEGAIYALHNPANPEALPQAAHSLRELMEKLEIVIGIPVTDKAVVDGDGSLGQKARELRDQWNKAKAKSKCLDGAPPADQIDVPLRKLLEKFGKFFDWFEKNPKFRAQKAHGVVKGLDPLASMLPQAVQRAQAEEWAGQKDYFVGVSHHAAETTLAEMQANIANLERFLHNRIAPVKAQNQNDIAKLIKDVEG
jgi:hypothetical protein